MHILPPEEPRRLSDGSGEPPYEPQSHDARTRHYHYHAAGDAEERLRRDAVRDYLVDEVIKRDARRRRRFKIALCLIFVGIVMMFVLSRTGSNGLAASDDTAVQVSSEYRDGKWVATAQRVPAPLPSPTIEPVESFPDDTSAISDDEDNAEGSGESDEPDFIQRYRMEKPSPGTPATTAALRRCQGHFISPDAAILLVKDRTITMWARSDVMAGDVTGRSGGQGEPTATGMLIRKADHGKPVRLLCETDHLLLTFSDNGSYLMPRSTAAAAEETLTAWMLER